MSILASLMLSLTFAAAEPALWPDLFGPADCAAVVGNGRLTVGVNSFGRISNCFWPNPSFHNQIEYQTRSADLPDLGVPPSHGVMWGLRLPGKTTWLVGAPLVHARAVSSSVYPVAETTLTVPGTSLTAVQTTFVHPEQDLLVMRLSVRGDPMPEGLFWYEDYSPCTRYLRELPVADFFPDQNDFAAYVCPDGKTIAHFRPSTIRKSDRERAERVVNGTPGIDARGRSEADWTTFKDGTWIAYTSLNDIAAMQCGSVSDATSAFAQATEGHLVGDKAAYGRCNSALFLKPALRDGAATATVVVAFGKEWRAVADALAYAQGRDYETLRSETDAYWAQWLAQATPLATGDPDMSAARARCLVALAQHMDRETGAIVRAPIVQPPLSLDWPRDGVWMTLALEQAGYHYLAEKRTLFYAGCVRKESTRGKPAGSLPAACYADGADGLPHVIVDAQATAWTLWSFWRHASLLAPDEKSAYLAKLWPATDLMGDFLAGWANVRTHAPLYEFDYQKLRDGQSADLLIAAYAGISSALQIAGVVGQSRPEWQRRKGDLDALIRSQCLEPDGAPRVDCPLRLWTTDLLPAGDGRWERCTAPRLARLQEMDRLQAGKTIFDLAMIWQSRPDKVAELRPLAKQALLTPLSRPDSLEAALGCLIAQNLF